MVSKYYEWQLEIFGKMQITGVKKRCTIPDIKLNQLKTKNDRFDLKKRVSFKFLDAEINLFSLIIFYINNTRQLLGVKQKVITWHILLT